jgi:hypothetical protein
MAQLSRATSRHPVRCRDRWVEVPPSEPEGSSGLRRADDCESSPGVVGKRKPVMPVDFDPAAFYGPVN